MNNFDLKKFLVENRLTTASKHRVDEFEFRTVDRDSIGKFTDKDSEDFMAGAGEEQEQAGITSLANPVLSAKVASLVATVRQNPNAFNNVKQEIIKRINRLGIDLKQRRQLLYQVQGITHPAVLQKWYNNNVLQETYRMNNFDLRKFLTENKLTTASKLTKENTSNGTVLEEVRFQDDTEQENLVFTLYTVADPTADVGNLKGVIPNEAGQRTMISITDTGEEFDVSSIGTLEYIIFTGEEEGYWREGASEDTHDFVINRQDIDGEDPMPKIENWLMRQQRLHEDLTVSGQEPIRNEASKYLKHKTSQAILAELGNELDLAQLEIKKEQIQKIVQEIESKISTLEEDAGMQGFVDKAAINEKRRVVKELNREYEKVSRIHEKMYARHNKKTKKEK